MVSSRGDELSEDQNLNLEVYKATHSHELELNRATATFEHAVLSPLYLLNGGAAVAFLTLLGAASGEGARLKISIVWAAVAAFAWTVGLLLATFATYSGYKGQRGFSRALRFRREEIEASLFEQQVPANSALPPSGDRVKSEVEVAKSWQNKYVSGIVASGCSFAVGAAAAGLSVLL